MAYSSSIQNNSTSVVQEEWRVFVGINNKSITRERIKNYNLCINADANQPARHHCPITSFISPSSSSSLYYRAIML
jgi:hypothetical protein